MSVYLIFDADRAVTDELAALRRARLTVAEVEAAERADIVTRYYAAADWAVELAVLAEAAVYDQAHPGEPPLVDELLGADTDYLAAA